MSTIRVKMSWLSVLFRVVNNVLCHFVLMFDRGWWEFTSMAKR